MYPLSSRVKIQKKKKPVPAYRFFCTHKSSQTDPPELSDLLVVDVDTSQTGVYSPLQSCLTDLLVVDVGQSPDIPAAKFLPVSPMIRTRPPVMYSQLWSPQPLNESQLKLIK